MKIKSLRVYKTVPLIEDIRYIEFNENGLSLIVDKTKSGEQETGNSVGKSTAIKIIDLCFGAKSPSFLYKDGDIKSSNNIVKGFLNEYRIQAEVLVVKNDEFFSLKRDLFDRGHCYINDDKYNCRDYCEALKKIVFNSNTTKPNFRQLMPKFIRLATNTDEKLLKFLTVATNSDYAIIYSFLFGLQDKNKLDRKYELASIIKQCDSTIRVLNKEKNISSSSAVEQQIACLEDDLCELKKKRDELSYLDEYRTELDADRRIVSKLNELQNNMQMLDFELYNIQDSIDELKSERDDVDVAILKRLYEEAGSYIPSLQKSFEDMTAFHNAMIINRIKFLDNKKNQAQKQHDKISEDIDYYIEERKKLTVSVLDENILADFNSLNLEIEDRAKQLAELGNLQKMIKDATERKTNAQIELNKLEKNLNSNSPLEKLKRFNLIFSRYCDQLYGEKYYFSYDEDASFPPRIDALAGNAGTGKIKALTVAFDLAYMGYAKQEEIVAPMFAIHDKMENTFINQLKTLFDICENIDGQFIIPILRERIKDVDENLIDKATVLELSTADKFFRIEELEEQKKEQLELF